MVKKKQSVIMVMVLFIASAVCSKTIEADWLVTQIKEPVKVEKRLDGREIVLSNGLISRTFRLVPNAATVAYDNLMRGESIIRGVKPEAIIELDGVDLVDRWIGGDGLVEFLEGGQDDGRSSSVGLDAARVEGIEDVDPAEEQLAAGAPEVGSEVEFL